VPPNTGPRRTATEDTVSDELHEDSEEFEHLVFFFIITFSLLSAGENPTMTDGAKFRPLVVRCPNYPGDELSTDSDELGSLGFFL